MAKSASVTYIAAFSLIIIVELLFLFHFKFSPLKYIFYNCKLESRTNEEKNPDWDAEI